MANINPGTKTFMLPSSITIHNVQQVTDAIKALDLQPGESLALDASLTENITTAGIQLLVSLQKTLAQRGGKLTIVQPKEAFANALRIARLNTLLTT